MNTNDRDAILARLMTYVVCGYGGAGPNGSECWVWIGGSYGESGYGQAWSGARYMGAHRLMYELHVGKIAAGLSIDHLCRNPGCVNPDHLEAVTNRENALRGAAPNVALYLSGRCLRGHVLAAVGTHSHGGRRRICAECSRARARAYAARQAADHNR